MAFCSRCGREYSLGQETCAKCGSPLPSPAEATGDMPAKMDPAPRLQRALAGVIDVLVAYGLLFALLASKRLLVLIVLRFGVALLVPHLYLLLKDSIEGKSIGKLLLGVLVYNEKERRAGGLLDSIIRNWYLAIPIVGPTLFVLVIAVQIISGLERRLGEGSAGTRVITDLQYVGSR